MSGQIILYYVHDPMCSWCFGFSRTWEALQAALPADITIKRLLGGLAPDSMETMTAEQQKTIEENWHRIEEHITGVKFNFDFWRRCKPRRSTYPACRAVIAARRQGEENDILMVKAIQNAYYRQARNPSDDATLIELSEELGLDKKRFEQDLNSEATHHQLAAEIKQARDIHVNSYPSLVLDTGSRLLNIDLDYNNYQTMLNKITEAM